MARWTDAGIWEQLSTRFKNKLVADVERSAWALGLIDCGDPAAVLIWVRAENQLEHVTHRFVLLPEWLKERYSNRIVEHFKYMRCKEQKAVSAA